MDWLKPIKNSWMACIKKAIDYKRSEFQDDADDAMRFFDGPYKFLYDGTSRFAVNHGDDVYARPSFCMTFNIVAEAVQLYGPSLYHRNPHRQVNPAKRAELPLAGDPNDPAMQLMAQQLQAQRLAVGNRIDTLAKCLEAYLNYTPNELDLRGESRQVIDEALIKGMGCYWHSTFRPPGSPITLVGSFYDSVDNLVIDPDMESIEHAKWIARRRVFPRWEVERRFNLPDGTLRGNLESRNRQAQIDVDPGYRDDHRRGDTNDLFTYWEVYSRMGLGNRLKLATGEAMRAMDSVNDRFGDHCFLAVCDEYPCPLNLPDYVLEKMPLDEVFNRSQWPTPFWADHTNPWPFTYVAFHKRPRKVWPMSHIKPAMGEIKFLNWMFSFLADKIKNTSRDFVGVLKSAGEDIKNTILSGKDLTLIQIESTHGKTIQDVVSFLQHPSFNGDVYRLIEMVMELLERRLGLNELMYGQQAHQDRSATVSQVKADQIRIRPDDMAECVEDAGTKMARKEALAIRWHVTAEEAAPIVGQELAMAWEQVVQNANPYEIVLELDYRIEAGSIRKPNRNREMENANQALQQWGPLIQTYFQATGDVGPVNAMAEYWAKAFDFPVEKLRFQPPPPPQPDPTEMMKAHLEQQKVAGELQADQQRMAMEMQKAQMELAMKQKELELKLQEMIAKIELAAREAQQKMALDAQAHQQELVQDQQMHTMDLQQQREQGAVQVQVARAQGAQKVEQGRQQVELSREQGNQKLRQSKREGEQKIAQQKAAAKAKPKPKAPKK
jgi:hypothetical protein